ncbi:MAG: alpha/beta fold hydrolase, partial [Candidatus Hydrogenedentes bacterium]|nr:alpha/beta fold hydrolase [Candidatus Hydrogenedentota bacterium]
MPYFALAHYMGRDQAVCCLQAPAFDGERKPCATIEEMAELYVDAIRSVQQRGPYHLGGWSFGGMVAYEVARQLDEQREEVGVVAMFDTPAYRERPRVRLRNLRGNARSIVSLVFACLPIVRDGIYLDVASLMNKDAKKIKNESAQRPATVGRMALFLGQGHIRFQNARDPLKVGANLRLHTLRRLERRRTGLGKDLLDGLEMQPRFPLDLADTDATPQNPHAYLMPLI